MIRKSGNRFSLATNAERVCAEIMLKQKDRARWRFEEKSSRFRNANSLGLCGPVVSCRPAGPVRHASGRYNLRTQLLDRRAMPHGRLPDQRKGIFFGKRVSAHHLQYRGEDDAPGADAILQFLDMGGL